MKLALLVCLAACAGSQAAPAHPDPASARAAITAVLDAQSAAWNRGDLAGYMDGYVHTPSLVFTSGGHIRRGWQDAFDHYKARYASDPKAMGHLALTVDQIDLIGAGGDAAVVLGRWDLTGTEHAGRGVFSLIVEHQRAGWRILHDHTSSETP